MLKAVHILQLINLNFINKGEFPSPPSITINNPKKGKDNEKNNHTAIKHSFDYYNAI